MKIAVIKTGGKQYVVKEGDELKVEKLAVEAGAKIRFSTLLIADNEGKIFDLGRPNLGEKVEAKALEQGRAKKVSVIKYKRKTRYRRNIGHRQPFTKVEITKIG